jgi:glycosyltransferase EpsJ
MDTFEHFWRPNGPGHRYGLEKDDPGWGDSTCWAGLLIAIGNEYARETPPPPGQAPPVEAFTMEPDMAHAIRSIRPQGLGRNKNMGADRVCKRQFWLLTLLYTVKNRGK